MGSQIMLFRRKHNKDKLFNTFLDAFQSHLDNKIEVWPNKSVCLGFLSCKVTSYLGTTKAKWCQMVGVSI